MAVAPGEATYQRFSEHALDRLAAMDRHLAAAGRAPAGPAREVGEVLEDAHSIKGTAAVLGVDALADRAAAIEQALRPVAAESAALDATLTADVRAILSEMRAAAEAVPERAVVEARPLAQPARPAALRQTVLHVEDAAVVVDLMQAFLADRGDLDLRSVATAREGLELARTLDPALIFLDMHLPDGSGEDVLRTILDDPATSSIPVVVVSGEDSQDRAESMVAAGAAAYVTKPFPAAAVRELVDRYCPPRG